MYSPLTHDPATRRAFRDVWGLRETPYLRDAIEHLVACAVRALDEETDRRLELVRPIRYRRDAVARLTLAELAELLRDRTATEATHA